MADKMMRVATRNDEGKAKALKSNSEDSLVTIPERITKSVGLFKTDYLFKKSGNLSVPHIAYRGGFELQYNGNNITYPTRNPDGWNEFTDMMYSSIAKKDYDYASFTTLNIGETACQMFSINILEELRNSGRVPSGWTKKSDFGQTIKSFKIIWKGSGEGKDGKGASLHYFNPIQGNFSRDGLLTSNSSVSKEIEFPIESVSSQVTSFIDTNGFIHFLARAESSADSGKKSYIKTNYIELVVEFEESLLTDPVSKVTNNENNTLNITIKENEDTKAYDEAEDRIRVSVEESTTRKLLEEYIRHKRQGIVVETLFDGEVDPDGVSGILKSVYRGEKETRVLINTDKSPWRSLCSAGPFSDINRLEQDAFFPKVHPSNDIYDDKRKPIHLLPIMPTGEELEEGITMKDVYHNRQLNDFHVSFRNLNDTETASVKIQVLRIFE